MLLSTYYIRQVILDEKIPVTMMDEVPNHFEAARVMFNDWMTLLDELLMPASHQVSLKDIHWPYSVTQLPVEFL